MKKLVLTLLMLQCIVMVSFSQWNYNGALYAPVVNNNEGDVNIQSPNGGLKIFDHGSSNFLHVGGRGYGYSKGFMFKSTTNNTADQQFTLSVSDGVTQRDRMVIMKSGSVGIGTTNPQTRLHVSGAITASDPNYHSINVRMDGTGIPIIRFSRDGDGNGVHYQNAFIGQFWNTTMSSYSLGIGTGSSSTGDANANNTVITIPLNGNVGIGTVNPVAKLTVNGNFRATEVRVMTDISIPDYVFENTYSLRPLSQVESYIKANKHLPEIPSAAEIKENGLNVAEMEALLLKKVEELTLYMIEMKKENEEMKKSNEEIKTENKLLKKEIEIIKSR